MGGGLVAGCQQQERCTEEFIDGQPAVLGGGGRQPPEQVVGGAGALLLLD